MPRYGVPGGKYLLAHLIFYGKSCLFHPPGCDRQTRAANAPHHFLSEILRLNECHAKISVRRSRSTFACCSSAGQTTRIKVDNMNEILVSESKTLKLTNVLSRRIQPEEFGSINLIVTQMENFVRSHDAQPIGPLVQHILVTKGPKPEVQMYLLRQANQMIARLDPQYHMDAVLRVKNCLYAHYVGPMSHNELASQKLNILAFENDIKLSGSVYSIFVSQDEDESVVDVFMEKE